MSLSKSAELTYTFIELGNIPLSTSEKTIRLLELFILYVYFGKDHRYSDINDAGYTVLSKDALLEYIKRSGLVMERLVMSLSQVKKLYVKITKNHKHFILGHFCWSQSHIFTGK